MEGEVSINSEHGVATLSFFSEKSNALSSILLTKLAQAFDQIDKDDAVRVVVLKSKGESVFCAGADFNELKTIKTESDGTAFFLGFAKVLLAMKRCSKIIVGNIQGKAVGGGVGLIAATDYVFALENAHIKLSELTLGFGPFVIEPVLKMKIGGTFVSQLIWNPTEFFSWQWSQNCGLFTEVYHDSLALEEKLADFVKKLIPYNPKAIRSLKNLQAEEIKDWDRKLLDRAQLSGRLALENFIKNQ